METNNEYYQPSDNKKYLKLMEKARRTNDQRDKDEREAGYASPDSGSFDNQLQTVMTAICCGIITEDWNAIAESQSMLEKIELKLRQMEKNKNRIILN